MNEQQPQTNLRQANESLDAGHERKDGPEAAAPEPAGPEVVEPKPATTAELLFGVLFQPASTFQQLARLNRAPVGLAVGVFAAVTFLGAWVAVYGSVPLRGSQYLSGLRGLPALVLVMTASLNALWWFGWSAIVNLVAELLGGRGRGTVLFSFVGLSYLPWVFVAPVAVIANVVGQGVQTLFQLLAVVWTVYLHYAAVRASHGLKSGRALLAVLLPGVAIMGLIVVCILMIMLVLMPIIRDMPELPL